MYTHCSLCAKVVLLAAVLSLSLCRSSRADTVYLKNGTEIEGTIVEENDNTVVIRQRNGVNRSIRAADVDTIVYEKAAKPATAPAAPEVKPEPKVETPPADAKTPDGKKEETAKIDPNAKPEDKGKTDEKGKEEEWTPPPGLSGFPDKAKRMSKAKEEAFMSALEKLASGDEAARNAGKQEIVELGSDALPYAVAGIKHANVDARTICMGLVAQFNGRTAVKQVIEVFYSAMPEAGAPATYQVPFVRALKTTLPAITGQTFITVEPDKSMVQDGLKKYLEWYEANYDRLPPQLGEAKIDATDPDYDKKLKDARKLKLEKRAWPRPPMPADMVNGPNKNNDRPDIPTGAGERPADQSFKDKIPTVGRDDALKRDRDR